MPNFKKPRGGFSAKFLAKSPFNAIEDSLIEGAGDTVEKANIEGIEGLVEAGEAAKEAFEKHKKEKDEDDDDDDDDDDEE